MAPALTKDFFSALAHAPTEAYMAIILGHKVTVRFNPNTIQRAWCIYPPGVITTAPGAPRWALCT